MMKENAETKVEVRRGTKPGIYWGKAGEVTGTIRIITGTLPSGTPYRAETFTPDRTPEEEAAWENRVKAACREFIDGCIQANGIEWARERLEARG